MMQFEISPEQKQLKETARRFAADEIIPVAARCDEEQTFAEDVVRKAWELGLMNFAVPQELGGADHLPARRRRVRPERHQTFHFER